MAPENARNNRYNGTMRLLLKFRVEREITIPLNYQHALAAAIYDFLSRSNKDYASFLHKKGYGTGEEDDSRQFKLFTFAYLKIERSKVEGDQLRLAPGGLQWLVSSPQEEFLTHFAASLLSQGEMRLLWANLPLQGVETLPTPRLTSPLHFRCLSPIVSGTAGEHNGKPTTRYLRPGDPEFSEKLRQNLLGKHRALHNAEPADTSFALSWDEEFLKRQRGTKKVTIKGIDIVGAFAPGVMAGSPDLIRTAYECGLGEKNSSGFGMWEVGR